MATQIYTGTQTKQIDRIAIDQHGYSGLALMTKAGEMAFRHIQTALQARRLDRNSKTNALILCGGGNNGGDGYVIARLALEAGWLVTLLATAAPATEDAKTVADLFVKTGGEIKQPDELEHDQQFDVVIDAVLGVGIKGSVREPAASIIQAANKVKGLKVAIDVPSGVDADTGFVNVGAFQADLTITFIASKVGLVTGPAKNFVGTLVLECLDIETAIISEVDATASLIESPQLPLRLTDSHKGSYGHAAIVGGDNGMLGAVLLAGRAALRSGVGKVHIVSTQAHLDQAALHCPELMSAVFDATQTQALAQANAIALGPGLGLASWGQQLFKAVIDSPQPMVIDADALTILANAPALSETVTQNHWVLTPHPGEAARLLDCNASKIQNDRPAAALAIAEKYHCVCVLKGAGTLVADASGQLSVCDLGNSGMATAGTGDVLSGIIAAMLAQGMDTYAAAQAGVWLHARAADLAVARSAEASLIASDIIEHLPRVLI